MYKEVDSQMNLPKIEEDILKFWDENKTFEKSLEMRKDAPLYTFYDGPPFATGTPHYGHIVASTMKDVVPRYWTMKGYNVPRKWGWDCHGLPIENIAEKALGITHKKQIEELGVAKFNETCRSKVLEYVSEWEKVIRRLGRWADMKNAYKTMDLSYMESVWWVFKCLWDKGLVYEGYRSMHICPRCETTLSQSEVSEGYKTVKDLSVVIKFKIKDQEFINKYCDGIETSFIAWTTTPWSIPSTFALAIGADYEYAVARVGDEQVIFVGERLEFIKGFKPEDQIEIIQTLKGRDMEGILYEHPFAEFFISHPEITGNPKVYKTYATDYVSLEEGTGIVTINGAFGEIDMNAAHELGLPIVVNVRMDGTYTEEMGQFAGMNVKPIDDTQKTDIEIIKFLAAKDALFAKEKYEHSYPHCWRCETPLLNYATSSWFVAVTKVKEEALKLAKDINWSPQHLKQGRFGKWLEGARDWSISRQRYWASVMPIWKCDKCQEMEVFGTIKDLQEKSSQTITDLHKDTVDMVTYKCANCGGVMKRIPDVLDTWFDSGSMPYAQTHYPFENEERFLKSFPAEFIAEGVDQTRAWFYYLHILATAIKDQPAFKNVAVNGIVLAEDGKKMSKRLQNYPDPMAMFDKYGADAVRFYLLQSPVMQAENLNFAEKDVSELSRGMFRMIWNSYYFFILYANIDKWSVDSRQSIVDSPNNLLDRWICSEIDQLTVDVNQAMENYDLTKASRLFAPFVDNLSNWYIRRSRKRFWKSENDGDKNSAYQTLWTVLVTLSKLIAPFTPFIADEIYRNLVCHSCEGRNLDSGSGSGMTSFKESVHLEKYPESDKTLIDNELNLEMQEARKIVEMGLSARAAGKVKVRQPLNSLSYHGKKLLPELESIIAEEVNVKKVEHHEGDENIVDLDLTITDELRLEGSARELIRNIQSLRKKSNFKVDDRITVNYETDSKDLKRVFENPILKDLIAKEVLANEIIEGKVEAEGREEFTVEGQRIWIGLSR